MIVNECIRCARIAAAKEGAGPHVHWRSLETRAQTGRPRVIETAFLLQQCAADTRGLPG